MKLILFAIRVASLALLLSSITLHWNAAAQFTFALIVPIVWGVTGYMEGYDAV